MGRGGKFAIAVLLGIFVYGFVFFRPLPSMGAAAQWEQAVPQWPEGWSKAQEIGLVSSYAGSFAATSDDRDVLSIAKIQGRDGRSLSLIYQHSQDAEEFVLDQGVRLLGMDLAVDEDRKRHLVWILQVDGNYFLEYGVFGDDGQLQVRSRLLEQSQYMREPMLAVGGQAPAVAWISQESGVYRVFSGSIDSSDTLTGVEARSSPKITAVSPSIDANGNLLATAWLEVIGERASARLALKSEGVWGEPQTLGRASRSGIQGGGGTSTAVLDDGAAAAWTTAIRPGETDTIVTAFVWRDGAVDGPAVAAQGSRPQLLWQGSILHLVWRGSRSGSLATFYSPLSHDLLPSQLEMLSVRRTGVLQPHLTGSETTLYALWTEAAARGDRQLVMAHTGGRHEPSFLFLTGLDEQAPARHLFFVFVGALSLAAAELVMKSWIVAPGAALWLFLKGKEPYKGLSVWYDAAVVSAWMPLLYLLPLGLGRSLFLGLWFHGLCIFLAWFLSSFMVCRLRLERVFEQAVLLLIWLMTYGVLSSIPEALVSLA